jgi:hypothetical protein
VAVSVGADPSCGEGPERSRDRAGKDGEEHSHDSRHLQGDRGGGSGADEELSFDANIEKTGP